MASLSSTSIPGMLPSRYTKGPPTPLIKQMHLHILRCPDLQHSTWELSLCLGTARVPPPAPGLNYTSLTAGITLPLSHFTAITSLQHQAPNPMRELGTSSHFQFPLLVRAFVLTPHLQHRITERIRLERLTVDHLCLSRVILEYMARDCVQTVFEHLQRWNFHNLCGQPVPVLGHPHSKGAPPHIQVEFPVHQFLASASCPIT